MRQRRQRLQVSTFPFLAVLLCAMGSLILLLLVIDRRAKVVARVKAMRAMEQALALTSGEEARAAAAHRAEWERRRQVLHEQLLQQDQQILGELQAVESKAAAAAGSVQAEAAHSRRLHEQLQAERSGLARSEDELTAQRALAASKSQLADASRAELASLAAELERMERTLADLKAVRQRQQQMYSLVPYRGKRGDNRKPLYIECSGDELIFHPDRLALHGLTLTPSGIRDEIERRLKATMASDPLTAKGPFSDALNKKKPEENAYLLMLIRPNGITTYYRTLAALKGLPMDFGYEFIDQDWILDFSEDENAPQKQPWQAADQTKQGQASGHSVKDGEASRRSIAGQTQRHYQGLSSGGTVLGRPMGILSSDASGPSNGSAAPAASLDANRTRGPRQPLGQSEPSNAPGGAPEGKDSAQSVSGGQRGTSDPPLDNRAAQGNGVGERQTERSSGDSTKQGLEGPPSLLPSFAPNRPRAATRSGMAASAQQAAGGADRGNAVDGQPGSVEPPRSMAGAIPLRPGPLTGNRDWIIAVECTADALVLRPSGQRIATAELARGDSSNNVLLEMVQRMIARRQATVRPGEPPYRPMIRFRVWPEGLRSYYLAYPALEALHVPMSRENLDPEP